MGSQLRSFAGADEVDEIQQPILGGQTVAVRAR